MNLYVFWWYFILFWSNAWLVPISNTDLSVAIFLSPESTTSLRDTHTLCSTPPCMSTEEGDLGVKHLTIESCVYKTPTDIILSYASKDQKNDFVTEIALMNAHAICAEYTKWILSSEISMPRICKAPENMSHLPEVVWRTNNTVPMISIAVFIWDPCHYTHESEWTPA